MCIALQVECPLFVSEFNEYLHFLDGFLKNTHLSNFTKICPVGATLFHAYGKTEEWADGRTGRHDETSSRFWRFCEGTLKRVIHAKHRICLPTVCMQNT
jgi:hypothetical protein